MKVRPFEGETEAQMKEIIKKIVDRLDTDMVNFCQRTIRVPSLSGDEKKVSEVYMEEMLRLGYDDVFRDEWGNISMFLKVSELPKESFIVE